MDNFRARLERIDGMLLAREKRLSAELSEAIDRITVLVAGSAIVLSAAAFAYALQQLRASRRIAERERVAEDERRERIRLQAAYDAEKRIADSLQTAFSQRPLPTVETLRFSASYVPATEETRLGGDWYDVIALPDDKVLFTIGDVTGHGIEAAITMNRARQAFVTGALFDAEPGSVLERVNNEMLAGEERLVTAVAGVADASTFEFVYAVAGHPPPVLLEPGRPPRFLDCGSLPLGGFPNTRYQGKRVQSVPGATLVLYTDGAVEHSRDVIEGEAMLLNAITSSAEHPEVDPATWIHQTIFQGRAVGDDVAILTIGFRADPALGIFVTAEKAQSGFSGRVAAEAAVPTRPESKRIPRAGARDAWERLVS
jgi:serine phosphatase RsbU (regulator of sigma subunit)